MRLNLKEMMVMQRQMAGPNWDIETLNIWVCLFVCVFIVFSLSDKLNNNENYAILYCSIFCHHYKACLNQRLCFFYCFFPHFFSSFQCLALSMQSYLTLNSHIKNTPLFPPYLVERRKRKLQWSRWIKGFCQFKAAFNDMEMASNKSLVNDNK